MSCAILFRMQRVPQYFTYRLCHAIKSNFHANEHRLEKHRTMIASLDFPNARRYQGHERDR